MEEDDCSLPVTKTTTSEESADVCPTEDAIRALIENLVDPLLPVKPSASNVPSNELKESVAKQVHAVVLLYNYYHRREHPQLECLSFESFRSLATVMRPALLQHLKESSEVVSEQQQTLLLEKAIVDACSLSASLDAAVASDLSISLKKWPIRKVAVLLVDSEKQNCYLKLSSITQGVWSLLEKTIDNEKTAVGDQNEEAIFQKFTFAAIKEDTGVSQNDLVILERHLAYSLSEEKSSTRFYIMKCNSQASFPEKFPIDDMLNSMQGPLFEKSFSEWAMSPIMEYYHVLPYASLIADWFSRREDSEFVIEKEVCDGIESNGNADETNESESLDFLELGVRAALKKSNDNNAKKDAVSVNNPKDRRKPTPKIQTRSLRGRTNETISALKAKNADIGMSPCKEIYSNGVSEIEPDSVDYRETRLQKKKVVAEKLKVNTAPVSSPNSNLNLEELQTTLLATATLIYENALKILLCKQDKLTFQQRNIEDEIAQCAKDIQDIKSDSELALKIILESCNDAYPKRVLDESTYQSKKKMKHSEPLPPKTSCQKLDEICLEKKWAIPNYRVSPSAGGFEAEIRMSEARFAKPTRGVERPNAEEARESAAVCLLSKLHNNESWFQMYEEQEQLLTKLRSNMGRKQP